MLAPPVDIVPPAKHALPGEGVWHVVGRTTANGIPTMYEAFVRPDAVHTSYVVGRRVDGHEPLDGAAVLRIPDPRRGTVLAPGADQRAKSKTLVAAFNSGFLMQNAHGGYFTDDRTYKKLRNGAASVVIFKNGRMTVAKWGRDVLMTNQIASVRQNLDLIVDNSKAVPRTEESEVDQVGKGRQSQRRRLALGSRHHPDRRAGLRRGTGHVAQ